MPSIDTAEKLRRQSKERIGQTSNYPPDLETAN